MYIYIHMHIGDLKMNSRLWQSNHRLTGYIGSVELIGCTCDLLLLGGFGGLPTIPGSSISKPHRLSRTKIDYI